MDAKQNPEKQIRYKNILMKDIIGSWKYGIYGKPFQTKTVYGKNGLFWREEMGLNKPKGVFNTWVKEEGNE